jgi:hypothetical protein
MPDVFANNRCILHQGDGLQQVAGPPDVCKTPSPGGPVPIPYPNIAMDSDLAKGTKKVKINGKPVATEASNLSMSTGDEAGTAGGGVASNKFKGKLTWGSASSDVTAEGKGVCRFMDVTQHNGNVWNTVLIAAGNPAGYGYGDDPIDRQDCAVCRKPKDQHRLEADQNVFDRAAEIAANMRDPNGAFAQAYRDHRGRPLGKGVMLGVLTCFCGARNYAGISGTWNRDMNPPMPGRGYREAANAFNASVPAPFEPVVAVVATPPPPLTGQYPRNPPPFAPMREEQWAGRIRRVEQIRARVGDTPTPLTCAAPKLVQKCLGDGHKPGKLIEIWVAMKPNRTVPIRRYQRIVANPNAPPPTIREWSDESGAPGDFGDGAAVPSCPTCQVTMTTMLCKLGQPPCP